MIKMDEKKCIKCGKLEEEHPYGYVLPMVNRMQFVWRCRKFKLRKDGDL